jgi:hypothetical protein
MPKYAFLTCSLFIRKFRRNALHTDLSSPQHIAMTGILLHQNYGDTELIDLPKNCADFLGDNRCQAQLRFIL